MNYQENINTSATSINIACSAFPHCKTNIPQPISMPWEELVSKLFSCIYTVSGSTREEAKQNSPAFSPAAYPAGATRGDRNLVSLQVYAIDFDNKAEQMTGEDPETGRPMFTKVPIPGAPTHLEVHQHLEALGFTHFIYSSYSSTRENERFRVLIPLDRPSDGKNWKIISEWLLAQLGMEHWRTMGCIDLGCLHRAASLYFLASYWDQDPEAKDRIQFASFSGKALALPQEEDLQGYVAPDKAVNPDRQRWMEKQVSERKAAANGNMDQWYKSFNVDMATLDIVSLIKQLGCRIHLPMPHKDGFMTRCSCPFADGHTDGEDNDDAAVFHGGSGWPGFYCFHDSCAGNGLRELCLMAGPEVVQACGQPYQPLQVNRLHHAAGVSKPDADTSDTDDVLEGEILNAEEPGEDQKPSMASRKRSLLMHRLKAAGVTQPIQFTDDGYIDNLPSNLETIFNAEKLYDSMFRINELTMKIEIRVPGYPHLELDDLDKAVPAMRNHLINYWETLWSKDVILDNLSLVAAANSYHPVRDCLLALPPWDEVDRIPLLRDEVLGANQTPEAEAYADLYAAYLRCTLIGAVRRVLEPGCKLDTVTILYGPQASRKSTFWRVLAIKPEWFNDSKVHIDSPEGAKVLHYAWITELSEIDDMTRKKSAEALKAFVSICTDNFRPSYGRSVQGFRRKCVMVGSTNKEQVLNDATGSRRFWVIPTSECINIDLLQQHLDQIWAQALKLYRDGEPHYLSQKMETHRLAQSDRYQVENRYADLMTEILGFYVTRPAGKGVTLNQIFSFLAGKNEAGDGFASPTQNDRSELANCLREHNWKEKIQRVDGKTARCWYAPESLVDANQLKAPSADNFVFPVPDFGSDPFKIDPSVPGL